VNRETQGRAGWKDGTSGNIGSLEDQSAAQRLGLVLRRGFFFGAEKKIVRRRIIFQAERGL